MVMLLLVAIAAAIIWGGWQWLKSKDSAANERPTATMAVDAVTGAGITIDSNKVTK